MNFTSNKMKFPKFQRHFTTGLIFLLWLTLNMGNAAHVAIIGHWKKSDMLLLNQNIFVQGRKRAKVSHKFHYTQKSDPKVISAVVLTNYDKSTFGAEGSLLEGGPNNIYCSIRLSARNNHDINFNLKIYSNNNVLQ